MATLYTHFNVDLDAASSVWAAQKYHGPFDDVRFVPANWDGAEMADDDLAVDISCGIKGEKTDGVVHAAFKGLMEKAPKEHQEAMEAVVDFVDVQDSTGVWCSSLPEDLRDDLIKVPTLNSVLRSLQAVHPRNDSVVTDRIGEILDGLLESGLGRQRAAKEAEEAHWEGSVAVTTDAKEFGTNQALFNLGAEAVVYKDGCNLGVVRGRRCLIHLGEIKELRDLVEGEEGWFFHPSGFLVGRGTRKAPATSPSKISAKKLAEIVNLALG